MLRNHPWQGAEDHMGCIEQIWVGCIKGNQNIFHFSLGLPQCLYFETRKRSLLDWRDSELHWHACKTTSDYTMCCCFPCLVYPALGYHFPILRREAIKGFKRTSFVLTYRVYNLRTKYKLRLQEYKTKCFMIFGQ